MGVSLYTSRVVLQALGVEDFGIYNIVGGMMVLFSFINDAMTSAVQRFLSFELGQNNLNEVKRLFSMSMTVYICIILIIVFLAETIGLWFFNTQMNIPIERMNVANWVYQISILTTCVYVVQMPYSASIIAYEKISFYAYLAIIEVIFRLLIAFVLLHVTYEKLKIYTILILFVACCIFIISKVYCNKKISTSRYNFFWDGDLYKKLMCFSGWSLFGSVANIGKSQGINILINIFCGVTVNTAYAISNQVINALNRFVVNFQTAFNPQVVKLYAREDHKSLFNLICKTSKYSFFLLLVLSLPVLLHTHTLLKMWLNIVPEYSVEFTQLIVIYMLIESISGPLWMTVQATGYIKKYQIIISVILLLNVPVSYLLLYFQFLPYYTLIGSIVLSIFTLIARIAFLRSSINLSSIFFFRNVLIRILCVSIIALSLSYFVNNLISNTLYDIIYSIIFIIIISLLSIYYAGMNKNEKIILVRYIKNKFAFLIFNIVDKLNIFANKK
ncbi:hypothetical protein FACS1894181_17740 [Bacteroidia bacterium]|nr:hypothetical protein FACS1894181_17740 [Bacteroidia bacterium]